jgi:eukaryotic-like serine/threonine-protein kinase
MKCPFCGTDNAPGETFCSNCGGYLDPAAAGQATVASTNSSIGGGTTGGSGNNTTMSGSTTLSGSSGNSRTLTPNARLESGRYVVDKILGQGGMGAAVLAKDTRVSNKLVVIKELISDSTDPTEHQDDVRNFEREVETLASLDHPLIPTVTDSFQEGSRYFMVQEYAAGENLEAHMERIKQPMPEEEALKYASQVLDILDYLQSQKPPIVHRDIKPANIIIGSKDKRAHLVDFGIARADVAKNAKKKQTSALGTPGYAPPEQYQGNADGRSDLYALGATLHHIMTNRDPRNYAPFSYPPARSVNPKLTADTERMLARATNIDINKRYQTAAEMKHDIDEILARRFSTPADTSSYMLGTSGPISAVRPPIQQQTTQRAANAPRNVPPPPPPPYPASRPTVPPQQMRPPQQQRSVYTPPPPPPPQRQASNGGQLMRNSLLLLVVVILIAAVLILVPRFTSSTQTSTGSNGGASNTAATPTVSIPTASNGIGVKTIGSDTIGISDGTYAFDTKRADGSLKTQASQALQNNNSSSAQTLWRSAVASDTTDAESLIYLENQRVLTSGKPYITIIAATMLTGNSDLINVGHESLQGIYVTQKEYNANNAALLNGTRVRVLIANMGSKSEYATSVANQIVTAAKSDKTIVGVTGLPYSSYAQNAIGVLSQAQIPMVSGTASSDALTGISPYFFRVAPSDTSQSGVGAKYALQQLKAKNVVVFEDQSDSYSQSLAHGFTQQFTASGGNIVGTVNYTVGNSQSVQSALQQALALSPAPDLIYFAGYSNDVSIILEELPKNSKFPNLQVLGGDALYNLTYPQSARAGFNRLRFTAFAYPDEWSVLGQGSKQPAFYGDFSKTYDPNNTHKPGTYGFTRAAYNVVLSYDAMLSLLAASKNLIASGKTTFGPTDVQQALTQITGAKAIQGASGQISFGSDGNPVDKAVLILYVSPEGFIKMESQLGAGRLLV